MRDKNLTLEDILTDKAREEDLLEVPLSDGLFKMFFWGILVVGAFVFFRFFSISVADHDVYSRRAILNMSDVKIEPAQRGIIVDRFGKSLIKNEPSFSVFLVPGKLPKDEEAKRDILKNLSETMGIEEKVILDKISKRNWGLTSRILIAHNISHDLLIALSGANIPGVEIDPAFKRVSENPLAFSHLIGYTTLVQEEDLKENKSLTLDDEIGRAGLEAYYDKYLRGKNGEEVYVQVASGKSEEKIQSEKSKQGARLETFIDKEFQEYFYRSLSKTLAALGRDSGVGIAMNPKNGEVLALVSIPGFDSGNLGYYLSRSHQPFFNRAVSGLYNPGSTIKPLHALAALVQGVINPEDQIFSAGYIEVPNPYNPSAPSRFVDWKPHGWVNLYSAIARSSNVYFYEIGGGFGNQKGLGIEKLKEWWKKFGLADKTNIDLLGEKTGFLPDPEWKEEETGIPWRLGDTYNISIGQGDLSITPLGLLNYINAIASGGKFYKPRVMKLISDENGTVLDENPPEIIRDESADIKNEVVEVQKGMREAVSASYGTANLLANLPLKVAGKTGSAQVENNAKTNAFFLGYAPYEDPEISILVLVENAREGSLNVVPVARDVFMWYYENRLKK